MPDVDIPLCGRTMPGPAKSGLVLYNLWFLLELWARRFILAIDRGRIKRINRSSCMWMKTTSVNYY